MTPELKKVLHEAWALVDSPFDRILLKAVESELTPLFVVVFTLAVFGVGVAVGSALK